VTAREQAFSTFQPAYWTAVARDYAALGPPLRPSPEDLRILEEAVATWAAAHAPERLRALLLGVTPDIVRPAQSSLVALDKSAGAIAQLWAPGPVRRRWAVRGDWLQLPKRPSSCDVVIGDGSINCMKYPGTLRELAEALDQCLARDGILVLRCFVRPEAPDDPEEVIAEWPCSQVPHRASR
jgi:hypothetical protein